MTFLFIYGKPPWDSNSPIDIFSLRLLFETYGETSPELSRWAKNHALQACIGSSYSQIMIGMFNHLRNA